MANQYYLLIARLLTHMRKMDVDRYGDDVEGLSLAQHFEHQGYLRCMSDIATFLHGQFNK